MKHTIHNHYYNNQSKPINLKIFAAINLLTHTNKNAEKYTKI